jgi:NAD+ kinase
VHSNVQSVLIVTKARDNRLIKLTRELALYLMLKPRQKAGRGMIVCVVINISWIDPSEHCGQLR